MKFDQKPKHPDLWMWIALIGPSLIWLGHLTISFSFAAYLCTKGEWRMHALTLGAMALVAFILWGGWRSWRFFDAQKDAQKNERFKTKGFLCMLALLLGSLLFLTVMVSDLSNVFVEPCL